MVEITNKYKAPLGIGGTVIPAGATAEVPNYDDFKNSSAVKDWLAKGLISVKAAQNKKPAPKKKKTDENPPAPKKKKTDENPPAPTREEMEAALKAAEVDFEDGASDEDVKALFDLLEG